MSGRRARDRIPRPRESARSPRTYLSASGSGDSCAVDPRTRTGGTERARTPAMKKKLYGIAFVASATAGILIGCDQPAPRAPEIHANDIQAPQVNGPSINVDMPSNQKTNRTDAGASGK